MRIVPKNSVYTFALRINARKKRDVVNAWRKERSSGMASRQARGHVPTAKPAAEGGVVGAITDVVKLALPVTEIADKEDARVEPGHAPRLRPVGDVNRCPAVGVVGVPVFVAAQKGPDHCVRVSFNMK